MKAKPIRDWNDGGNAYDYTFNGLWLVARTNSAARPWTGSRLRQAGWPSLSRP